MKNHIFGFKLIPLLLVYATCLTVPVKGHCQQDGHQDIDKMAVTGRVSVQQQGPEEWIVLHGRDAKAYLLTGYLRDRLREMALKTQQHNLSNRRSYRRTYGFLQTYK